MHEKEAGVGPFKKSIQNWSVNDLHTFGRKIFEFESAFFSINFHLYSKAVKRRRVERRKF